MSRFGFLIRKYHAIRSTLKPTATRCSSLPSLTRSRIWTFFFDLLASTLHSRSALIRSISILLLHGNFDLLFSLSELWLLSLGWKCATQVFLERIDTSWLCSWSHLSTLSRAFLSRYVLQKNFAFAITDITCNFLNIITDQLIPLTVTGFANEPFSFESVRHIE